MVWHHAIQVPLATLLGVLLGLSVGLASAQGALTMTLNPVGGSGASAAVTLTPVGDQTTVTITARGLAAGSQHLTVTGLGQCASLGEDLFRLPTLVAGAGGTATASTTLPFDISSLTNGNWQIHFNQTAAGGVTPGGPVIACGNIPTGGATAAITPPTAATTATAVAAVTAVATTTPTALPVTGGIPLPVVPAGMLGAAVAGLGILLRRQR